MRKFIVLCIALSLVFTYSLSAKVLKVKIESQEIVLNGQEFGNYGQYELIKGKIWFVTDPGNIYNQWITDIHLSARDENGLIISVANFEVLQPVNSEKSRGLALVEVSNRGGKFSLRYFNRSRGGRIIDVANPDSFGDGLLMRNGLTVIWVGWQFDVPVANDILRLEVPEVRNLDGSVITGLVRSDWTVDQLVNNLSLGHRQQAGYLVSDTEDERTLLTVRDGRESYGTIVPDDKWGFGKIEDGKVIENRGYIYSKDGFEAGKIYELVYVSDRPVVTGLGLTAIRDVISYAKYDPECPFKIKKGIAAGVSQTGRFLRHFLYQGFNTDESGRQAYDGMMIITAGAGRGSFNHRFGQPSRDAHRYSAFFYPTDIFPFTSRVVRDPEQWKSDGLLAHMWNNDHVPKIFYCNTGYEYWGRAASLIHTDPDGVYDIEPFPNEKIYMLASGQHYVGPSPTDRNRIEGTTLHRGNSLDFSVNYRSLLVKLADWVEDKYAPPESAYPRIDKGTLVSPENVSWPVVKDLILPSTIHVAYLADYGPRWDEGIVDYQPPLLNKPFPSLVSAVDKFGNDIAGIRNIEITVPLGTFLPWNLRTGYSGGENELVDFTGTFIPLQNGPDRYFPDARPGVEDLYKDFEDYLSKVDSELKKLIQSGYVLQEDREYLINKARSRWNNIMENNP